MAKVTGSYDSVVLGVSEQVAHNRRSGQMAAQTNLISDHVNGLCRRRGSVWKDERVLRAGTLADYSAELAAMRVFDYEVNGVRYSLMYRKHASAKGKETFAMLYNRSTDKWLPIVYENSTWIDQLVSGGVSAIAAAGRFLYIAGNSNVPDMTATNNWDVTSNLSKMVAWIKAGAYSRTFTVTLIRPDNSRVSYSYTTKPSAYPTALDVSGIPFYELDGVTPRPDYQKDINDAVYAYQSAVNEWIKEAAEDILPQNIADKIAAQMALAGVAATSIEGTVCVNDDEFSEIEVNDGGDNTLMVGVGKNVSSPDLMSTIHWPGKVVRISPTGDDNNTYYLQAYAKDGVTTSAFTQVQWRESAGVVQTINHMVALGTVDSGTLYIAQDAAGLASLTPSTDEFPGFKPSRVGDATSAPTPNFIGKTITMLHVFQDRLLIGAGAIVNASRPQDYLNFFRHTVVNVRDDDSIEMFAHGSDGDILRYAVMYDKDLLIFGDSRQYGINGRVALSATSPNITVTSGVEDATSCAPIASGNFVWFGKNAIDDDTQVRTSLNQIQVGQALNNSLVSWCVSDILDTYIAGVPAQVLGVTKPNMILYRTEDRPSTVYAYGYIDNNVGNQRLIENWSEWVFANSLGVMCGLSQHQGNVLLFSVRQVASNIVAVADKQSLNTKIASLPYLDSMRRYDTLAGWHAATAGLSVAVDDTQPQWLLGTPIADIANFRAQLPSLPDTALWVGAISPASVTPTNPYYRDQNGKPVLNGRLTLGQVAPTVVDTSGVKYVLSWGGVDQATQEYRGRTLGFNNNIVGQQPVTNIRLTYGVGREVRECAWRLDSLDWLPLSVSAIDYTGQWFSHSRRIG